MDDKTAAWIYEFAKNVCGPPNGEGREMIESMFIEYTHWGTVALIMVVLITGWLVRKY